MAAQLAGALRPPRIELFFKTPSELKERLRDLTAAGYRSFNLVNKDKKDPMLAWVDVCCEQLGPGRGWRGAPTSPPVLDSASVPVRVYMHSAKIYTPLCYVNPE